MSKHLVYPHYFSFQKRIFDILLSLIILIVSIPFFIIGYLLFIISMNPPFIFKQQRVGKNKIPFTMYKIRTMKIGAEKNQKKLKDLSIAPYPMFKIKNDPRFTAIGKTLSKFGIDELPQIINILKGEMSFIGPRPLPTNEAKLLGSSWDFRYKVKPGILSFWALSPKRYESLSSWKKLEKRTLKISSIKTDFKLIFEAINQVIIRQFLR